MSLWIIASGFPPIFGNEIPYFRPKAHIQAVPLCQLPCSRLPISHRQSHFGLSVSRNQFNWRFRWGTESEKRFEWWCARIWSIFRTPSHSHRWINNRVKRPFKVTWMYHVFDLNFIGWSQIIFSIYAFAWDVYDIKTENQQAIPPITRLQVKTMSIKMNLLATVYNT